MLEYAGWKKYVFKSQFLCFSGRSWIPGESTSSRHKGEFNPENVEKVVPGTFSFVNKLFNVIHPMS